MGAALAIVVCAGFLFIAAWHFRMALRPMKGESAAVPSVDGKPLFQPSKTSTVFAAVPPALGWRRSSGRAVTHIAYML